MKKIKGESMIFHGLKFKSAKSRDAGYTNNKVGDMGRYAWVNFLDDPVFNSYLFNKFIGMFVKDGKRNKVDKIIYSLFGVSDRKIKIELFFILLERVRPALITVPIRIRNEKNYVPIAISEVKSYRRGIFFIAAEIKKREFDKTLKEKIFNEFYDTFFTPGHFNSFAKKNYDIALANSYLKHYRRFAVY